VADTVFAPRRAPHGPAESPRDLIPFARRNWLTAMTSTTGC